MTFLTNNRFVISEEEVRSFVTWSTLLCVCLYHVVWYCSFLFRHERVFRNIHVSSDISRESHVDLFRFWPKCMYDWLLTRKCTCRLVSSYTLKRLRSWDEIFMTRSVGVCLFVSEWLNTHCVLSPCGSMHVCVCGYSCVLCRYFTPKNGTRSERSESTVEYIPHC